MLQRIEMFLWSSALFSECVLLLCNSIDTVQWKFYIIKNALWNMTRFSMATQSTQIQDIIDLLTTENKTKLPICSWTFWSKCIKNFMRKQFQDKMIGIWWFSCEHAPCTEKNDENLFVCYSKSISASYGFMPYLGGTPAEPCFSTFFDGIFYTLRMQPLSWEHSSLVKTLYRIIIFVIVEEHKIIQYVYSFTENTKVQHKLRRAIDNIHMHVVIKTRYICPWNHLKLSLI